MAITVRHGHFGRFGKADWKLWLGAAALGGVLVAGGFYFTRDGGDATPVTTPGTANSVPVAQADAPAVAPITSAATSFRTSGETANVVYIVGSEEQMMRMQLAMQEADSIRAWEGLGAYGGEFVILDDESAGTFIAGIDEANTIRAAEGLAPFRVIDLR
jgi:hypothetical protein